MSHLRLCVGCMLAIFVSSSAFAKTETLAERGQRMCEEAGVAREDCTILPPDLRGDPDDQLAGSGGQVERAGTPGDDPGTFGTGRYGWCEDCTSLLGAAPVTPWSVFGGRRFQPLRDEDGRETAAIRDGRPRNAADDDGDSGSAGDTDGGDGENGDGGDDGDDGGNDGGDGGDGGDGHGGDRDKGKDRHKDKHHDHYK